jgi:ABC-type protease/lipase transport system fused ATPase/permease subunit
VRSRGGIVVVIAHRPSALAGCDMVLAMSAGRVAAFGPKDEVLAKVLRPATAEAVGLPVTAMSGGRTNRPVTIIGQGASA